MGEQPLLSSPLFRRCRGRFRGNGNCPQDRVVAGRIDARPSVPPKPRYSKKPAFGRRCRSDASCTIRITRRHSTRRRAVRQTQWRYSVQLSADISIGLAGRRPVQHGLRLRWVSLCDLEDLCSARSAEQVQPNIRSIRRNLQRTLGRVAGTGCLLRRPDTMGRSFLVRRANFGSAIHFKVLGFPFAPHARMAINLPNRAHSKANWQTRSGGIAGRAARLWRASATSRCTGGSNLAGCHVFGDNPSDCSNRRRGLWSAILDRHVVRVGRTVPQKSLD